MPGISTSQHLAQWLGRAAVGDSRSDLPLFGAVGLAIAFNAAPAVKAAAAHTVDGHDLTAILPYLRTWLDGRRAGLGRGSAPA